MSVLRNCSNRFCNKIISLSKRHLKKSTSYPVQGVAYNPHPSLLCTKHSKQFFYPLPINGKLAFFYSTKLSPTKLIFPYFA
jgi:hypothetical protein